jgi:hypothetical protein
MFSALL